MTVKKTQIGSLPYLPMQITDECLDAIQSNILVICQIFCVDKQFLASPLSLFKQGTKRSCPNFLVGYY